jgi:hypothetical protein
MEPKRYVVTAALAATLGIVGTLTGAGLTEKEGERLDVSKSYTKDDTQLSGAQTAIDGFASNEACDAILALPNPPASCVAADVYDMRFSRRYIDNNGDIVARVEALVDGVSYQAYTTPVSSSRVTQLRTFAVSNFCAELMAERPVTSTCSLANILEVGFCRVLPGATGWYSRVEGVWQFTLSEGAPDE